MFGIGMPEMILILAVALIVIGPKKLPDLAKSLGRALGEFKRATSDLKESIQLETGFKDVRDSFADVTSDLKSAVDPVDAVQDGGDAGDCSEAATDDALIKAGKAFGDMENAAADPGKTPAGSDHKTPRVDTAPQSRDTDRS